MTSVPAYDLSAIAVTGARILDVPVPAGARNQPISEVLATLPSAERLVLVVIDAFGTALWKYVEDTVPHLNRLAAVHRLELSSVLPSLTYVCMTTIFSGISPDRHGVVDRQGLVAASNRTETLFATVRRTGRKTLMAVHLKGVQGVPVEWLADTVVVGDDIYDDEIHERVPGLITEHLPAFAFLHLTDIDEIAHVHGPYTEAVRQAAGRMDERLERLFGCLARQGYAVLVMADHGMHEVPDGGVDADGHRGTHDGSVAEDRIVPLVWASAGELRSLFL